LLLTAKTKSVIEVEIEIDETKLKEKDEYDVINKFRVLHDKIMRDVVSNCETGRHRILFKDHKELTKVRIFKDGQIWMEFVQEKDNE